MVFQRSQSAALMPFGGAGDRRARAARLRPLLVAQLAFAERLRTLRGEDRDHGLLHYTNLHRRFGYGVPSAEASPAGWLAFLEAARRAPNPDALVDVAQRHFVLGTEERPLAGNAVFGCFSFTAPGADGRVLIHFIDRESNPDAGPLARVNLPRRRRELARLTYAVITQHPEATHIRGRSWLYHRASYRRLFPLAYVATRTTVDEGLGFQGGSCWGQLQTRLGVDSDACARLVERLPTLDAEYPWRVFPSVPQAVEAPIERFAEAYLAG